MQKEKKYTGKNRPNLGSCASFCTFLLEEEIKKLSYLAVLCLLFSLKLFVTTSRRDRFQHHTKKPQLLLKSLDGFSAEHTRLLPSSAAKLAGELHAFQDVEVNLRRGTLNAIQKLQDVLVCFAHLIRTAREKAKFPKLWVEHGTV